MMNAGDEGMIKELLVSGRKDRAFRLLVETFSEPLYWHIRRMLVSHEDTDDVLQNVFIKAWQSFEQFRWDSKLYTWIYRIATNEALNFLNEKKRKVFGNSVEISSALENALESSTFLDGNEIELLLQKAILHLSDRQRLIFNMRYFEDIPYEDIAACLDVAEGTVKATYHQAIKKIERELKIYER